MSKNDSATGSGTPLWIIVAIAVLAGAVGSAGVLSANQFLAGVSHEPVADAKAATILAGPDRPLPKGPVIASVFPSRPSALTQSATIAVPAANDPRWGSDAAAAGQSPFELVDKNDEAAGDASGPVALAALAEDEERPTAAAKADNRATASKSDEKKPKRDSGPITGQAMTLDDVNMRAGPNSRSAVLAVVPAKSAVDVVNCASWCEISVGGKRGYVYSGFLRKSGGGSVAEIIKARPADGEVKSSVTIEPSRKWTLVPKRPAADPLETTSTEVAKTPAPAPEAQNLGGL